MSEDGEKVPSKGTENGTFGLNLIHFCFVSIFNLSFKLIVQKAIIKYYRFHSILLLDALIGHSQLTAQKNFNCTFHFSCSLSRTRIPFSKSLKLILH